jgi:hypothetical protein
VEVDGIVFETNLLKMGRVGEDASIVTVERVKGGRFGALGGRHSRRRTRAGQASVNCETEIHGFSIA